MYEYFEKKLKEKGLTAYKVAKATGITQSTLSDWKRGRSTPKTENMQKIADFLDTTVEYLMTGKDIAPTDPVSSSALTPRDERDIAKDLENIMNKIRNGKDVPLRYNGQEIDERSLNLLESAIEMSLRDLKAINKEKYNPHKNNK